MKKTVAALFSLVFLVLVVPVSSAQVLQASPQRVSADEMKERMRQGMEERFNEMDEDEDGSLSKEEFKKMFTQEGSGPSTWPSSDELRERLGESRKTSTSASSAQADKEAQRARLIDQEVQKEREKKQDEQFTKFDENGDGKLSKEEYLEFGDIALQERLKRTRERRGGDDRQPRGPGRPNPQHQRGP